MVSAVSNNNREQVSIEENPVLIPHSDYPVLKRLAALVKEDQRIEKTLQREIDRAIVVQDAAFPPNTIRINSVVEIRNLDTGTYARYKLVLPAQANIQQKKISVLSAMGTALIGIREGAAVEWKMPGRLMKFRVEKVIQE